MVRRAYPPVGGTSRVSIRLGGGAGRRGEIFPGTIPGHGERRAALVSHQGQQVGRLDTNTSSRIDPGNSQPQPGLGFGEKRIRVLLSAVTCNPYSGSEPGCGWGRVLETARHFDVWLIFGEGESAIRQWLTANGELPTLRLHYLPPTPLEKRLVAIPGMLYVAYNLWQRRAYWLAKTLHDEFHFDIVHQVNLTTYREPGYLWKLGAPFVWGPVAGFDNYPWRFLRKAGIRGAFYEGARNVVNSLQFRFSPRVRAAARHANALLTVNSAGKKRFLRFDRVETIPMLDLGTTAVTDRATGRGHRKGPLRILWISSFLHGKAFHLLVEALGTLPDSFRYELRINGRGPLEKRWRRLAIDAGIERHCRWDWITPEEVPAQYDWADVLVFTSLRDACGSVVLEAVSHGLPVICLDHQGASEIITAACGVKIPVTTPGDVVKRLRDAIVFLERNRGKLDELSEGAVGRAREFLWSRKIEQTARIYREVLAERASGTVANPRIREAV
jgi:glycosyltransferase involved in cell wall biosynthesis